MKVILTEKVPSLGNVGEIVTVAQGFGRNYLLPMRKAVLADAGQQKQLANQQRALAKKVEAEVTAANEVKGKLDGLTLELVKKVGSNSRLFGSVTNQELKLELGKKGIEVERRLLVLENPIKALGTYTVKAKLFTGVEAEFKVKVDIDPAQAEEIRKKQEAAAKRAEKKAADAEAGIATEGETTEETVVELTEEQKLQKEADELLRS